MEYQNMPPMKPDNHLVWAILCTLCCCLPLGIVSIVYSSKVDGLYVAGRHMEAQQAADSAKNWAMWGAIIGGIGILAYLVFYGAMIFAAIKGY